MTPTSPTDADPERCRTSHHRHGHGPPAGRTGLLAWEAERFEAATRALGLDPAEACLLHCAARTIEVSIPLLRDDGSLEMVTGYRVQHSMALGAAKGGLRFHPDVGVEEVTALARIMTWKTALAGLPFGGAKGGLPVDPADYSRRELKELTTGYTLALLPHLGGDLDVLAPDLGTNAETMAWVLEAAARAGRHDPALVTGKPPRLGGTAFRRRATGVGVAHVAAAAYRKIVGRPVDGAAVAIEGFGNVGRHAAAELVARGARLVAVGDVTGTISDPAGIDVDALTRWVDDGHPLAAFPDAAPLDRSPLTAEADLVIPAAMEGTLDEAVAAEVGARLVVEGANGPTTPAAERRLHRRGIAVVPDLVANAGGVISSWLEWVQARRGLPWEEPEERRRVLDRLAATWESIGSRPFPEWRQAALTVGIGRVLEARRARGELSPGA